MNQPLETMPVRLKDGTEVIINKIDFDAEKHSSLDAPVRSRKAAATEEAPEETVTPTRRRRKSGADEPEE